MSACTRTPRPGEIHGKDYYFYTDEEFKQLIDKESFIEWEMVYTGKYYGTLKSEVERIWQSGHHPLVDIDVQGALAIQSKYPDNSITLFIQAPSLEELRKRLELRGTETAHTLDERVSKATLELSFAPQFDKIVINDNLDEATTELVDIVREFINTPVAQTSSL